MARVLITAFEPYDRWKTNASWLALVQLTHNLPPQPELTTRLYPVDFAAVRERLSVDLDGDYDYALHLGQAPGIGRLHLEAVGLNIGGSGGQSPDRWETGPSSCAAPAFRPRSRIMPARFCAMRRCTFRATRRTSASSRRSRPLSTCRSILLKPPDNCKTWQRCPPRLPQPGCG